VLNLGETLMVITMNLQQFTAINKESIQWKKLVKDCGIEVDRI
jgi:hypothetical protein